MVESGLRDSEGVSNLEELELNARDLKLAETFLESDAESSSGGNSLLLLRNPLHFALSISPLYLLIPSGLVKVRVGPRKMLDVS